MQDLPLQGSAMKTMSVLFHVPDISVQLFHSFIVNINVCYAYTMPEGIVSWCKTKGKAQKSFLLARTFRPRNFTFFFFLNDTVIQEKFNIGMV